MLGYLRFYSTKISVVLQKQNRPLLNSRYVSKWLCGHCEMFQENPFLVNFLFGTAENELSELVFWGGCCAFDEMVVNEGSAIVGSA